MYLCGHAGIAANSLQCDLTWYPQVTLLHFTKSSPLTVIALQPSVQAKTVAQKGTAGEKDPVEGGKHSIESELVWSPIESYGIGVGAAANEQRQACSNQHR